MTCSGIRRSVNSGWRLLQVQPVLLAVERHVDQTAHARGKGTDGQVEAVVLHAELQFVGAHDRQMQMHRRVLLTVGADGFGERQGLVADGGVDHTQVQGAAQLAFEGGGVLFETFKFRQQTQGFLMEQLALAW